jgi:prevent-host-death family protein
MIGLFYRGGWLSRVRYPAGNRVGHFTSMPGLLLRPEKCVRRPWFSHRRSFGAALAIRPLKDYIRSTLSRKKIMRSANIKPISYLKANAAEVLKHLAEQREPFLITQNGEARAVMQDIASYESTQETLAFLKILALGNRDFEEGKVKPIADAVRHLRARKSKAK